MSEISKKNLSEIIDLIKKEIKSEELSNLYIDKVNKSKKLNSYITTCFEHTIQKSKSLIKPNLNSLLPGVPLAVKDLFVPMDLKLLLVVKCLKILYLNMSPLLQKIYGKRSNLTW